MAIDFGALGPAVGERFPDVRLNGATGATGVTADLHAMRAGRRALVVFHRSARW